MNIILVGKDIQKIGEDVKKRVETAALIDVNDLEDDAIDYMKNNQVIALCDTGIVDKLSPWTFKEVCEACGAVPFFIAEQTEAPVEYSMCVQMNTWYPTSACYIVNDNQEDYDVFLNILESELRSSNA